MGEEVRILWLSNAPWAPSGYGEQTGMFVRRLQQMGHEVGCIANYGLHGVQQEWNGLAVYPADSQWGNRTTKTYADHFQADLVIALCDAWVLKPSEWPEGLTMSVWAPVDHEPLPPAVFATLNHENVRPISMSHFGDDQMRKLGLDPCYVPHGIDTNLFKPQPEIRESVRAELGIPQDVFLVGMVAANKGNPSVPRKSFPQAFHAFSRFAKDHDDAWLYVHTNAQPQGGGGIGLDKLAVATECPAGRVRFPPDEAWDLGMPSTVVAALYSAFDVLLSPSMGEGFGIPILEAQACGVPVITSNHSAMVELTQAGWLVDGDPWWDALQDSFAFVPSIASIHTALEAAYEARTDVDLRAAGVAFAEGYDADTVAEKYWKPALEKLVANREVPPLGNRNGLNRAARRKLAKQKVPV